MVSRRNFIHRSAAFAGLTFSSALLAKELDKTPRTTEGPFYPDKLPLDTDNDLLIITDRIDAAVGKTGENLLNQCLHVPSSNIQDNTEQVPGMRTLRQGHQSTRVLASDFRHVRTYSVFP